MGINEEELKRRVSSVYLDASFGQVSETYLQIKTSDVLPFFEEHNVKVQTVLTDNGREYCGREDQHPFELFLQLEEIEHRTTRVRRPQSNGYVERLHRTLLDEHFRIAGRTKFYESIEEMQIDLEIFFEEYNYKRSPSGKKHEWKNSFSSFH